MGGQPAALFTNHDDYIREYEKQISHLDSEIEKIEKAIVPLKEHALYQDLEKKIKGRFSTLYQKYSPYKEEKKIARQKCIS